MSYFVHYRFRSQKTASRIQIYGTGISAFDLKRAILVANDCGKDNNFDLVLYDEHNEVYREDAIIPRSSSVLVKRVPAANITEAPRGVPQALSLPSNEAAAIAAMFAATNRREEDVKKPRLAHCQIASVATAPTPPGYVCHRCGLKGSPGS
ncbi:DWNN-domain-containing protein [Auricularia subglabra TFB-10046 SS5]|nr:DWNN-domain-containing protein [Auricularia subglabra TFB-10046 SS5]